MKILIVSDIHENFDNLSAVLKKIPDLGVEKIICLGDLINGGIGRMLARQDIPCHLIWGNNDGNRVSITKAFLDRGPEWKVANNEFDTCVIDGRKIFLTHYPIIAKSIAKSADYDAVFYGHDHIKHQEIVGDCLLLNPGEISAHKTGICSYSVYDTATNSAETYSLDNPIFTLSAETKSYINDQKQRFPDA